MGRHEAPLAVDWLRAEFLRRRRKNQAYSLRAYARHLGLSPGPLSEILGLKRALSSKIAEKLVERLGLDPQERAAFLSSVGEEPSNEEARLREIGLDAFHVIADWYHYALLSLIETQGFRLEPRWIAKRLGISSLEARVAWERLERLGLVEIVDGKPRLRQQGVTTPHDVPSAALRRAHRQSLGQAARALEEIAVEDRDFSFITMAIDPAKLDIAKSMIRKFRRELAKVVESGRRTEVYRLGVYLMPLSRKAR